MFAVSKLIVGLSIKWRFSPFEGYAHARFIKIVAMLDLAWNLKIYDSSYYS